MQIKKWKGIHAAHLHERCSYLMILIICLCTVSTSYSQQTIRIKSICEICDNGIDDDGDGNADCRDRDCIKVPERGILKSLSDTLTCDVFTDYMADTISVWGAGQCIDVLTAEYIDTSQIKLSDISCIQYQTVQGSCPDSEGKCQSGQICTSDTCQYYISLIGHNNEVLTSEFVTILPRQVDYALLRCAFPHTDSLRLEEVVAAFNKYKDRFEINTPLRIAHFLGQIGHETNNLTRLKENCRYSPKALICTFGGLKKYGSLFEGFNSDQNSCSGMEPTPTTPDFPYSSTLEMLRAWATGATITDSDDNEYPADSIMSKCDVCGCNNKTPRFEITSTYNSGDLRVKQEYNRQCEIFDVTYGCRLGNGAPGTGDGSRYAGVAFLHLTGKATIDTIQRRWNEDPLNANDQKDFLGVHSGELISDIDVALKASMYFWEWKSINDVINGSTIAQNNRRVTIRVNGGTNHLSKRLKLSEKIHNILTGKITCDE